MNDNEIIQSYLDKLNIVLNRELAKVKAKPTTKEEMESKKATNPRRTLCQLLRNIYLSTNNEEVKNLLLRAALYSKLLVRKLIFEKQMRGKDFIEDNIAVDFSKEGLEKQLQDEIDKQMKLVNTENLPFKRETLFDVLEELKEKLKDNQQLLDIVSECDFFARKIVFKILEDSRLKREQEMKVRVSQLSDYINILSSELDKEIQGLKSSGATKRNMERDRTIKQNLCGLLRQIYQLTDKEDVKELSLRGTVHAKVMVKKLAFCKKTAQEKNINKPHLKTNLRNFTGGQIDKSLRKEIVNVTQSEKDMYPRNETIFDITHAICVGHAGNENIENLCKTIETYAKKILLSLIWYRKAGIYDESSSSNPG